MTNPFSQVKSAVSLVVLAVLAGTACVMDPPTEGLDQGGPSQTTTTGLASSTTSHPPPTTAPPASSTTGPQAATTTSPHSDDTPCSVPCVQDSLELVDLIDPWITGGDFGFLVYDKAGQVLATHNAGTQFYPASAIKVVHLIHALSVAPQSGVTEFLDIDIAVYTETCTATGSQSFAHLGDLLQLMMFNSDNAATNAIQDHFGLTALRDTVAEAEMVSTELHHRFGCGGPANTPANVTTAHDLARAYEAAIDGTLLNDTQQEAFTELLPDMARDNVTTLDGSPVLPSASIAHAFYKEGWYDATRTIAGMIVTFRGDTFFFAAFTDGANALQPGFAITRVVGELVLLIEAAIVSGTP